MCASIQLTASHTIRMFLKVSALRKWGTHLSGPTSSMLTVSWITGHFWS